ncbi:sugar phosphate isomerase/epimerase [Pseudomonas sp. Irchel 3E20]|uniref:sugar phosphate isomerase/epimerase family protein n=1 Tax=Pseudomonas sp. Irchel 3E20 TaxID=2008983 RepID=UPI000BA44CB3|nr:sugar phosphate isomerase/epimerase family protein [Pseudomonas sp. Irchel 3E20]
MRLAVSNIAWDVTEDEAVVQLLQRYSVDAIDIAPGKYFAQPANASDSEIAHVKVWWNTRGIEITGMQALLFGTSGLNVFGAPTSQKAMLSHLKAICRIGAGLGATRLVFGSPKNRDRTGLSEAETQEVAISFFRELGDIAQTNNVTVCLEPNPTCYGANFMTTSAETAYIVKLIAHPSIKMQLDTGALAINGEDPYQVLQNTAPFIGHIHASEPNLVTLGDGGTDHQRMAEAIRQHLTNPIVSIEMLGTQGESHVLSIERALQFAEKHYRSLGAGVDK